MSQEYLAVFPFSEILYCIFAINSNDISSKMSECQFVNPEKMSEYSTKQSKSDGYFRMMTAPYGRIFT